MPIDIFRAALEGQSRLLIAALDDEDQDVNGKDVQSANRTALHHAASTGDENTIQALLDRGADIQASDDLGATPLLIAVSAGHVDAVKQLIGAGAEVAKANAKGMTALHYAASKSWVPIGELLVAKGADINARDSANQLPLHRAASVGSSAFIRFLLAPREGIKPRLNLADRAGNTPLHLAIESGHGEAACVLIEAGADRQRTNQDGQRPEELDVVGGQEGMRLRQYITSRCGPLET